MGTRSILMIARYCETEHAQIGCRTSSPKRRIYDLRTLDPRVNCRVFVIFYEIVNIGYEDKHCSWFCFTQKG